MQLYTPIELKQLEQDLPYLIETTEWVNSFLAQPHPDLGRPGPVCPFVPHALKSNSIRLAAIRAKNLQPQQVEEIVLGYRNLFLEIEPQAKEAALYKAILLVFTDIEIEDTSKLIDGVQQKLKPLFVESGLMLGEFHNGTESPGLHNPNFRPLRSPIPILAIRFMVESDLPFLQATDDLGLRIRYLEAYLQRFGEGGKEHINLSNARQILALARTQLEQQTLLPLSSEIFQKSIEFLAGIRARIQGQKYIGINDNFFLTLGDLRKVDTCKKTMLEGMVAKKDQQVSARVGQQMLREWNDSQVEYAQDVCIHSLFEAQVERSPDSVAVVCSSEHLTYRELNTRANQLAHHLQSLGVRPEVLVGLCVERSIEMVVGMLGILKAGGAYVPLDPAYPEERLKFMLSDSQASVLLTTKKLVALLPAGEALLVCLDTDCPVIWQQSQENAVSDVTADNLMYVIYTSGSTGQPKGVMIAHRGICNQLYWRQKTFGLTPQDKVLQTISLSFDPSVWQIFWPLLFGAQLILAHPGGHQDTAYLVKTIAQERISVIALVPSILRVLLEEQGLENCQCLKHVTIGGEAMPVELIERFHERLKLENVLYNCYGPTEASIDATFWKCQPGTGHTIAPIGRPIANTQIYILDEDLQPVPVGEVGQVYIGGAGLARGYLHRPEVTAQKFIPNRFVRSRHCVAKSCPLESPVLFAFAFAKRRPQEKRVALATQRRPQEKRVALATQRRPQENTQRSCLEGFPHSKLLPRGEQAGERGFPRDATSVGFPLCELRSVPSLSASGVEELGEDCYLQNSCSAKLYKTGDLGRYLPDGNIEFVGRMDHQVKIRGFRIELGEIEAMLCQHPALQQTLVMAREDVPGDKRLVAYVVAKSEKVPSMIELRDFLMDLLPEYMVPSAFVFLDTLPLNPNGKVDRGQLPAPDTYSLGRSTNFVAAGTPTEVVLAAIWEQVLGVQHISIHDNFFTLGGHSLLATQVISRCNQVFGVDIPLQLLFDTPTIAGLAGAIPHIQTQSGDAPQNQTIPQTQHPKQAPLSFAQQRVWFLEQLEPNTPAYVISQPLRLKGKVKSDVLLQSMNAIIAHHQVLLTNFILSPDGSPIQVIGSFREVQLTVIDLTNEPESDKCEQVQNILNREALSPFNLASDLMLRATLVHIDEHSDILVLVMHHIASDGWSMGILWQQLATVYEALLNGLPNPLTTLPIQYADFAVWQRQWLSGIVLHTKLDYWKNALAGANHVLELPTDQPRPPIQTHRGAKQRLLLPQRLSASLKTLSHIEGVTLFMTLLAAFGILLHRYSGQDDLSIGSPIAGRNRAEVEQLIGFFINTVVLRLNFAQNPTFRSLLRRVRQVALDAFTHQDLPFEKLVEELQLQRDTSRNPLFQVWFNMLNLGDIPLQLFGLDVEPMDMAEAPSKFDLSLYVTEQKHGIQLELVYNSDLFFPERMMEMLSQYHHLLIQIVENPAISIAKLSIVTPKAKLFLPNPALLLEGLNCSPKDAPNQNNAIHHSFSQQAQRVPQQLAVVDAQSAWTYGLLEERANQLAHYLLCNHLQSQDIVAIYGHRSATLVWALLGVLKAGCAFMILDPAYPADRLKECLKIAQPRAWLQITAAGPLPTAVQEYVDLSCRCCQELSIDSSLAEYPTDDPTVTVAPDDLAYVAFTSGTTGFPKGIKGTHRPLCHFLQWHENTFGLCFSDRFSLLSGLSHDPLLRDIFTPLSIGATIYIPQPQDLDTPTHLADWMRQKQVSIAHVTPAMAQLLTADTTISTTHLRYLFFSGDVLTKHDVTKIRHFAPHAQCVNFYGSTETPQAMGYFIIPNHDDGIFKHTIPLGRGISDVQLLVLTTNQQLAGISEVGEIYVRTSYLAQGYIGDDELTQHKFILNPWTNIPDDRLYRTGDFGRYLPDGNVEFVGRFDHQVKIRGFRIELADIEAVLAQHPSVQDSVVIAREHPTGDKHLVAYVVPRLSPLSHTSELRDFLNHKLPNYMIPSTFVILDSLSLTPNGKVDRLALPVVEHTQLKLKKEIVLPRTLTEEMLARIWAEVLSLESSHRGRSDINIYDNFFELGGHSLAVPLLMTRIRQVFKIDLPLWRLFKAPTIAGLAESIESDRQTNMLRPQTKREPWSCLVPIQLGGSKRPFFLVPGGIGGEPEFITYAKMVYFLGQEQPVYGLQARGWDGKQKPHTEVEVMAAEYIKEIRTLQPSGPYLLGGECMGGVVAFEMARQLVAVGQKVRLLVLMDTKLPSNLQKLRYLIDTIFCKVQKLKKIPYYLTKLLQRNSTELQPYTFKKARKAAEKLVEYTYGTVIMRYKLRTYTGPITLLVNEDYFLENPSMGWHDLALGGLEIHKIPGNHESYLGEYVKTTAEKLKACLDAAQVDDDWVG